MLRLSLRVVKYYCAAKTVLLKTPPGPVTKLQSNLILISKITKEVSGKYFVSSYSDTISRGPTLPPPCLAPVLQYDPFKKSLCDVKSSFECVEFDTLKVLKYQAPDCIKTIAWGHYCQCRRKSTCSILVTHGFRVKSPQ